MKKTKSRLIRAAACIGVGAVVLTTAVFANFDNANGYSTIKTAAKNSLFADNYTAAIKGDISLDNESRMGLDYVIKVDKDGNPKYKSEALTDSFYENDNWLSSTIIQDGYKAYEYRLSGKSIKEKYPMTIYSSDITETLSRDNEVAVKSVNFAESLCDTLIGDIKNNIVLVNNSDDTRTYSLNMSGEQLPKYVTAAFSLFTAAIRTQNEDIEATYGDEAGMIFNEIMLNENEPYINCVNGNIVIDSHDRITGFDGKVVLTGYDNDGNYRDITFSINLNVSDYGTTSIESVNLDEYKDYTTGMHSYKYSDDSIEVEGDETQVVIDGAEAQED